MINCRNKNKMSTNNAVELWAKAVLAAEDAATMLDLAWDLIAEIIGAADARGLRTAGVDLRTAYKSLSIRDEIEAEIERRTSASDGS